MKNKSKPIFFAAVVLQALLLIIPVSVFARAEDAHKIGVPQAIETPRKGCAAAVLLPDEGRIYSVYEGVLNQYAISPFKKLGSTVIDLGKRKDSLDNHVCYLGIPDDKSKFVLLDRTKVLLLDVSTGQILSEVERKNDGLGSAILNNTELVTLDVAKEGSGEFGVRYFFNLKIWDASSLKFKREIRDLGKNFGFFWDQNSRPFMSKSADRIYMKTDKSLLVLNSKTYTPELTLYRPGPVYEARNVPKISKNFKKLYFRGVSKVTDHLAGKTATYDDVSDDRVFIFDQEMREFSIENMKHISQEEYVHFLGFRLHISRSKEYLMSPASPSITALRMNLSTGVGVIFNQYESGEAILRERFISGGPEYFQITPGARKYLMMKNSAGKIVPINDSTFAKYHRAGISHSRK